MTHKFVMELEDNCKGYKEEVERLERMYGIEPIDEHDKQISADAIDEFIDKFIKRNQFKQMTRCECINDMYVLAEQLKERKNEN